MTLETIYDGDGSDVTFNTNFDYLEQEDISVAVKPSGGSYATKTLDTHYTVSGQVVTFTSGNVPPNNSKVRIRRHTPVTHPRHTFYAGSTVTAKSLNDNTNQILNALEERGLAVDDETDKPFTIGTHNEIKVNSATNLEVVAGKITLDKMAINSVDSDQYVDGSIDTVHIGDDQVTADKLANSINTEIAANTAKVTNATHTGEVTGATALTVADNVIDEANLKISNAGSDGDYLTKQSGNTGGLTWAPQASMAGNLMRQVQFANGPASALSATTDGAWNTIISLAITTTTNDARVFIQISGKPRMGAYRDTTFKIGLFRDTTELYDAHDQVADNSDNYHQITGVTWVDSPGNAGTYTYYYKVAQTQNFGSNVALISSNTATIMLTELGPNP